MKSILVLLHCESNTGYAIAPLEATFYRMALTLCGQDAGRIHFGYPSMARGPTDTLPADFRQYLIVDTRSEDPAHWREVGDYIQRHDIDTVFGFDQPVSRPIYRHLRRAGVRHFIAYWGAPMSSVFGPVKRLLKRIDVLLRRHGPDHYIFESQGMADTAVLGRGIRRARTSVIFQGVDTERFQPVPADENYVYEQLQIPAHRRIFFYAGHMEPRKGVAVIMRAANRMAERPADDWQIVLFGNQPGQESSYLQMLTPAARAHVLFGGYRHDLPRIQRGCHAAVIASTGWDSFPRSGVEMQSSGLPLLASGLPGLREIAEHGKTGFVFRPGDDAELAEFMARLLDEPGLREQLSRQARTRALDLLSLDAQLAGLVTTVKAIAG
jgi:glycosyltransferase involved in cell wall biosynthesis